MNVRKSRKTSAMQNALSIALTLTLFLVANAAQAAENPPLRIAVATNFATTAEAIAGDFAKAEGVKTVVVSGSSGKLTAQIIHGAPFDVFLSADRIHPQQLARLGLVDRGRLHDYAVGTLTFIGREVDVKQGIAERVASCRAVAVANPESAPYGLAALQVLEHVKVTDAAKHRLVMGESVGQTMAFLTSGAADCGFVGTSQVREAPELAPRATPVASALHEPIAQSAVVLAASPRKETARRFMRALLGKAARARIQEAGYGLP